MTYSSAALHNPFLFVFLSNHLLRERPHRQAHTVLNTDFAFRDRMGAQAPCDHPSRWRCSLTTREIHYSQHENTLTLVVILAANDRLCELCNS